MIPTTRSMSRCGLLRAEIRLHPRPIPSRSMSQKIAAIAAGTVLGLVLFAGMGLVFMKWGADPAKDSLVPW